MFLPDGKALVMDPSLFKYTIERSIVIDLVENRHATENASSHEITRSNNDDGVLAVASRKEINRKPS